MLRRPPRPSEPGQLNLTRGPCAECSAQQRPLVVPRYRYKYGGAAVGDAAPDGISPSGARFPESFARLSACRDSGDIATELREPHR